jgi:hypothetical protein
MECRRGPSTDLLADSSHAAKTRAAVCLALVSISFGCAQLASSKRNELAYAERLCATKSIVGEISGVKLEIDAQREKLKSAKGRITAEKYRRLSQELKDYDSKWESLNQSIQLACREWALCQYRQTPSVVASCRVEREAMERREDSARRFIERIEALKRDINISSLPIDPNKIFVGERYPYELDESSSYAPDAGLRLTPQTVLRKKYVPGRPLRFTPVIENQSGSSLEHPRLQVHFLQEGLNVRHEGGWQVQYPNRRYSFAFGEPINNTPLNVDGPLWVTFPSAGKYTVEFIVDGDRMSRRSETVIEVVLD